MKTIIAIAMAIAMVSATSYTLGTGSSYTFTLDVSANASNSSTQDLAVTLGAPDVTGTAGTASSVNAVGCVNTDVANYTLAADATALSSFIARWTCDASCNTNAGLTTGFQYSATAAATYTHSTTAYAVAASTFADDPVTLAGTSNDTAFTNTQTLTGATPANAASMGLPNMTQTAYLRCWIQANLDTAVTTTGAITFGTNLATAGANVTVKGSSYGVAAVLAVAGSLAASFAF